MHIFCSVQYDLYFLFNVESFNDSFLVLKIVVVELNAVM